MRGGGACKTQGSSARLAMFRSENKTLVNQCTDTDILIDSETACIDGNQVRWRF